MHSASGFCQCASREVEAYDIGGGVIANISKGPNGISVKLYRNGVLTQEAIGDINKANVIIYDGNTMISNTQDVRNGMVINTTHTAPSQERLKGTVTRQLQSKGWVGRLLRG